MKAFALVASIFIAGTFTVSAASATSGCLEAQDTASSTAPKIAIKNGLECYNSGNEKLAVDWWKIAANKNDGKAQYNLGLMYAVGKGVDKDDKIALNLFAAAASKGIAPAQYELGYRYWKGDGVPKDDFQSYIWVKTAQESGFVINGTPIDTKTFSYKLTDRDKIAADHIAEILSKDALN